MPSITLTIELRRHPENGYELTAKTKYDFNNETKITEPLPITFNESLLRVNNLNPQGAGDHLTRQIFGGTELRPFLQTAESKCDSQPLELRLVISKDCPELHGYPWEQMLDPSQLFDQTCVNPGFWFLSQRIAFARGRDQKYPRRPSVATRHGLRALLVIADPTDIDRYKKLSPIDATAQSRALSQALAPFAHTTILARNVPGAAGLPTLAYLNDKLQQQPHLVYLICHGTNEQINGAEQQTFWLEQDDGRSHQVPVNQLVNVFRGLSTPPPLVLLSACHSAGDQHRPLAPDQIGPTLIDTGVGAVIAMRGKVQIADVKALMPKLLTRLAEHGRIDVALAEARATMPAEAEWWRAVLFIRSDSGQIWHEVEGYDRLLKGLKTWQKEREKDRPRRFAINEAEIRDLADRIAACASFERQREALLKTIEYQHDQQAIVRLLDQLWLYEDASDERDDVEDWFKDHLRDLPFNPTKLAELQAIFMRIANILSAIDGLKHCLRLAFKNWGAPPEISGLNVAEWLHTARLELGGLEVRHKQYQPLVAFCETLAGLPGIEATLQADLRAWARSAVARLGIADTQSVEIAPEGSFHHAYLCLVVKPTDLCQPYQIEMNAFFFPGGPDTNQGKIKDWEPVHLDHSMLLPDGLKNDLESAKTRIIAYLRAVAEQILCRLALRSLMVEIFLPDRLWEIAQSLLDVKVKLPTELFSKFLAPQFPLAIRLIDRLTLVDSSQKSSPSQVYHINRWQEWKSYPIFDSTTCHWVRATSECEPEELFNTLLYSAKKCVIGLVRPSDPFLIAAAIREAGVPIALWVDETHISEPNIDTILNELLAHGHDLPVAVCKLRGSAWTPGSDSQLGRYLTLLWDNPNRLPPALLFQTLQ